MPDQTTTVAELKEAVRRFAAARAWEPYHSPKNLVMALACEAAELTEHFLWLTSDESRRVSADPERREAIADELADVGCVLFNLSLSLGIDLSDAVAAKMVKNERKYPADEVLARERAKRAAGEPPAAD
jgi:NTP pyrophosphatase (non-canonical NTP hydrolase)